MAINETIFKGRKWRVCIDKSAKKWNRYSYWTAASDVEFDDGSTLENRMSSMKGITKNIDSGDGYAADISLVKSIKTSLTNLITSLTNLVNSINNRLGGLRFYEDSNGKWVVGADSVPKKLGSGLDDIANVKNGNITENVQTYTSTMDDSYLLVSGTTVAGSDGDAWGENGVSGKNVIGCWTDITTDGKIIAEKNIQYGVKNTDENQSHPTQIIWFILVQCDNGQSVFVRNNTWGHNSKNNGGTSGTYLIMSP